MPTLSDDDIETLRVDYIRDKYAAAVVGPPAVPAVMLSHYNRMKMQFISDSALESKANAVLRSWGRQISGVYSAEFSASTASGLSDADSDARAAAIQKDAFFRLIRAAVFEDMMLDPGFVGSIADESQRKSIFSTWKDQIKIDRTFTTAKTSAPYRGRPLEVY